MPPRSVCAHVMLPSPDHRGLGLRIIFLSRPLLGSPTLRPGDSLTIPRMALSVGFIRFVSSTNATQATGSLTLSPVGLSPTEHASFSLDALWSKNPIHIESKDDSGKGPHGRMVKKSVPIEKHERSRVASRWS